MKRNWNRIEQMFNESWDLESEIKRDHESSLLQAKIEIGTMLFLMFVLPILMVKL